jgi:hypothetical protein
MRIRSSGHVADALLELGLARLPAAAAELVERASACVRAVARQELDVLDREEQPVAAGIDSGPRQSCGAPDTSSVFSPS